MAEIQVTTLIDENDLGLGQGFGDSLREAITFAGPEDTITFANTIDGGTINLINGELVIDQNLTIDGNQNNTLFNLLYRFDATFLAEYTHNIS